jgi:hypothetical protein
MKAICYRLKYIVVNVFYALNILGSWVAILDLHVPLHYIYVLKGTSICNKARPQKHGFRTGNTFLSSTELTQLTIIPVLAAAVFELNFLSGKVVTSHIVLSSTDVCERT